MASIVAAVVVAGVAVRATVGGIDREVTEAAFAGSLGVVNDVALIERLAAEEFAGTPDAQISRATGRAATRCLAAARDRSGASGPLRLVAEVRVNGVDALVLVTGRAGSIATDVLDAGSCEPVQGGTP
jgi:hypothetical protein